MLASQAGPSTSSSPLQPKSSFHALRTNTCISSAPVVTPSPLPFLTLCCNRLDPAEIIFSHPEDQCTHQFCSCCHTLTSSFLNTVLQHRLDQAPPHPPLLRSSSHAQKTNTSISSALGTTRSLWRVDRWAKTGCSSAGW